jgi:nucleotide-binding universal stress UspA family protein
MNVTRILVPVDFSLRSEKAVRYARSLAHHFSTELVVVHVLEPVRFDYAMIEPSRMLLENAMEERRSHAQAELRSFVQDVRSAVQIVAEGDPAEQIVQIAAETRADLIIIPTQGHSRIRQFLIGSVTAKVLHDSPIPILTGVHLPGGGNFPELQVRSIVCAVDFGPQSATVLRAGARVADHFGAHITVLHVVAELNGLSAAISAERKAQHVQHIHDQLTKLIDGVGLDATCFVEHGEPHKVVTAKARQLAADVVIIGRGSVNHVMGRLRAQAYGIVRQAPCPVLSV